MANPAQTNPAASAASPDIVLPPRAKKTHRKTLPTAQPANAPKITQKASSTAQMVMYSAKMMAAPAMARGSQMGEPSTKSTISQAFSRRLGRMRSFAIFVRGVSATACRTISSMGPTASTASTASSSESTSSIRSSSISA